MTFDCPLYRTYAPKHGFCQGCEALALPLTKTKLAIIRRGECVDLCRSHSLAEHTKPTHRTAPTNEPSTQHQERQPARKGEARSRPEQGNTLPCGASPLKRGEDLSRGVLPPCGCLVCRYLVPSRQTARKPRKRGGRKEHEKTGGEKPRAGGLPGTYIT